MSDITTDLTISPDVDTNVPGRWKQLVGKIKLDNLFDQFWEHTVSNVSTNSFDINIDSRQWPTWASGGYVAKQIRMQDVASGGLPLKRVIAPQGQNVWPELFLNGSSAYSVVMRGTYDAVFDALIIDRCPGTV